MRLLIKEQAKLGLGLCLASATRYMMVPFTGTGERSQWRKSRASFLSFLRPEITFRHPSEEEKTVGYMSFKITEKARPTHLISE